MVFSRTWSTGPSWLLLATITFCFCASTPHATHAQDVQPRVYTPAPVGMGAAALAYSFSTGPVLFDKTIPIDNSEGDIHSVTAAYSRSVGVFGLSARTEIAVPFVTGTWTGNVASATETSATDRTGFGDPVVRLSLFVFGAPALTAEEFTEFQPKTVVGATMRIRVPIGQYDPDQLINLGSNRWMISPQMGVSHVSGRFLFEGHAAVWFFANNKEFLGSSTLSQDPLFVFQAHVGYLFPRGMWLAASSRQSLGGATDVDGSDNLDPETNNRVGLTLGVPVGRRYVLKVAASTGLTSTVGNDYHTLLVAWQVAL